MMATKGQRQAETNELFNSWKIRIKSKMDLIYESLEIDPVLDFLLSNKGITERQMKMIKEQSPRREQIIYLFGIIDRTYEQLELFVSALDQSDQKMLAVIVTGRL